VSGADVFERACYRCGAEEELVADEHVEGFWICRPCLERVEAQNELIRRGLEEEPDVEM
jgi:hypothetical protein